MQRRRDIRRPFRREDATGQAGWMYTDLLLGLMIVFMATVSFLPEALPGKSASAYVYSQHFEQVFERVYSASGVDSVTIENDVKAFLEFHNLPEQSIIEQAQFVGGFDQATENVATAIGRAVAFSTELDASDPVLLGKAATSVDASSDLPAGQVIVRFKFGVLVR